MITEDYISFETAKLLKEKGFDEKSTKNVWVPAKDKGDESKWVTCSDERDLANLVYADEDTEYAVYFVMVIPTQALVLKWLRVKYNIAIFVAPVFSDYSKWAYSIMTENKGMTVPFRSGQEEEKSLNPEEHYYTSPKEAAEAAIVYSLKNLIK